MSKQIERELIKLASAYRYWQQWDDVTVRLHLNSLNYMYSTGV